ncbi:HAD family hydrolase [Myxococcota bacterium]|nr:HAD family hydrolase [Myxococcota bacterium]
MSGEITRLAMWSGPRNISTAMMYSFGNRPDAFAWDEPFYASYLAETGLDHPMRDVVIAAGETNYLRVAERCLATPPGGATLYYQKHMTHHMLPSFDHAWITALTNVFLVRDPVRVLASYVKKRAEVSLTDLGFVQQAELFDRVADHLGRAPLVLDADDVLTDPRALLTSACRALGLPFFEEMLSWSPGPKSFDGAWAPHWYDGVWASTGFGARPVEPPTALPSELAPIADAARPIYERMRRYALGPAPTSAR